MCRFLSVRLSAQGRPIYRLRSRDPPPDIFHFYFLVVHMEHAGTDTFCLCLMGHKTRCLLLFQNEHAHAGGQGPDTESSS